VIKIATVDDWFRLARRFPEFKVAGLTPLKDYGVMACMEFIEERYGDRGKDLKILEFGHGFNSEVMARFQDKHEVWGADRDQGLVYFSGFDWEARFAAEVAPSCGQVTFVRELLSLQTQASQIPDGYFDVVLSVSVLEEVQIPVVADVVSAAYKKLKPGGVLIGTHDLQMAIVAERLRAYLQTQRQARFVIEDFASIKSPDWRAILLENAQVVMLYYQVGDPEETRRYWGHFATVFTVATKPGEAPG
jgi:SAM-dependent methyltransferase